MSKRKPTEAPASVVATAPAPGRAPVAAPAVGPASSTADVSDASRRKSALAGLHGYFRGQEAHQSKSKTLEGKSAWVGRPTMAIAEMVVLLREITLGFDECRYVDPLPVIRPLDADGCNWEMPSLAGDDEVSADCRALVSGAIENLRARYNLC